MEVQSVYLMDHPKFYQEANDNRGNRNPALVTNDEVTPPPTAESNSLLVDRGAFTLGSRTELNAHPATWELRNRSSSSQIGLPPARGYQQFTRPESAYSLTNSSYAYFDENGEPKSGLAPSASSYAYCDSKGFYKEMPIIMRPLNYQMPGPLRTSLYNRDVSNYRPYRSDSAATIAENSRIGDVFGDDTVDLEFPAPVPPNNMTLNKYAYSTQSQYDLNRLNVPFEEKQIHGREALDHAARMQRSTETLNKRLISPSSAYELSRMPSIYNDVGSLVIRDYSAQSLMDIRDLPDPFGGETEGVDTARQMSGHVTGSGYYYKVGTPIKRYPSSRYAAQNLDYFPEAR